jgi:hypothetical protein
MLFVVLVIPKANVPLSNGHTTDQGCLQITVGGPCCAGFTITTLGLNTLKLPLVITSTCCPFENWRFQAAVTLPPGWFTYQHWVVIFVKEGVKPEVGTGVGCIVQ